MKIAFASRVLLVSVSTIVLSASALAAPAMAASGDWSTPVSISAIGQNATDPQIAVGADGSIAAIWSRYDGSNDIMQATISTDNGATWSAVTDLSAGGQNSDSPQVAIAPDGSITAIWTRYDGSNNIVQSRTSTNHGATWSAVTELTAGTSSFAAQLTIAPNGSITGVWIHDNGSKYIVQSRTSTDNGATWGAATDLSTAGQNADSPRVATASDSSITAVWTRFNGSNDIVQSRTSTDNGATWSAVTDLSAAGASAHIPRLAIGGSRITAIWTRYDGGNIVQSRSSSDHGSTWSTVTDLSAAGSSADEPDLFVSSDGTIVAIWAFAVGPTSVIQSSTSTDGGATWSTPFTLSSSAVGKDSYKPHVVIASDGTITAIWQGIAESNSNNVASSRTSTDGGATWSSPTVSLSDELSSLNFPSLAVKADGTVVAIWVIYGDSSDVIQVSVRLATNPAAAPGLAATGINAAPLGLAGSLLLLIGGGLLLNRRRTAHSA